ncbi:unnamed protein product [Prunus armeniaca]
MGKKSKSKTPREMQDNRAVGIGGSFSGPLQTDPEAIETARGRQLHFLANVDPIDVARNIAGLNLETTLERKPGRSGHLLHKNCASGSLSCSCKRFSGEGRCSLIGPPVTALVCSNGNQGQLVFCKQHGTVVKERSFKSLLDWLKRVVFLPLITILFQSACSFNQPIHMLSYGFNIVIKAFCFRVPAHLTSQCLKNRPRRLLGARRPPRRLPRGLYLEEGTPSSCSQNERQTKEPIPRRKNTFQLENAFIGTSPGKD